MVSLTFQETVTRLKDKEGKWSKHKRDLIENQTTDEIHITNKNKNIKKFSTSTKFRSFAFL